MVATAQTGTGKTLAFLLPIIEALEHSSGRVIEALVLVPTRELAMQVDEQYEQLRSKLSPAALAVGGLTEKKQLSYPGGFASGCRHSRSPGRLSAAPAD